jgi:hypothetical protein
MAIASTEIRIRLSGGASNTSPASSLGGARSGTDIGTDLFDNISAAEAAAGDAEYRCVYVYNANSSLTLTNAKLWISTAAPAGVALTVGVGTAAMNGTEQTVADEGTAPSGVAFSTAASEAAGVALGDIPPLQGRSAWLRRVGSPGIGAMNASPVLAVSGETAA